MQLFTRISLIGFYFIIFYHNREPVVLSPRSQSPVAHGTSSNLRKPFSVNLVINFYFDFCILKIWDSNLAANPEFCFLMQMQGTRLGDFSVKVIGKVSLNPIINFESHYSAELLKAHFCADCIEK